MIVKYALKKYNKLPHTVPITKEFLNLARIAHQKYDEYLKEKRKAKKTRTSNKRKRKNKERRRKEEIKRIKIK